ncbi:hypothetical protein Q9Q94_05960 [Uliginosibacterium sp. 31-16]|uniref:hypothetical protein n=1 Tax=Uliginosibacterium sp. 31-16 TaxID=3068315 RepID=UPI00273E5AD1|nr:hypothetical protein [Uliginosibacterium sp. 31-16]MDP5239066.1 hypothetical protein [Uliginosibacterium sp. 31-16]
MRNMLLWLVPGVALLLALLVLALAASALNLSFDELDAAGPGLVVCAFAACFMLLALLLGAVLRRRCVGKTSR